MGTRIIGGLAVLGGLAFGGMVAFWSFAVRADPGVRPWELPGGVVGEVIVLGGILALGLSMGGLPTSSSTTTRHRSGSWRSSAPAAGSSPRSARRLP